jgi:hypothetical protein
MAPVAKVNSGLWRRRSLALALILALPLIGMMARGQALTPYLSFPPRTLAVPHAPFSLVWSAVYAFIDIALLAAIGLALWTSWRRTPQGRRIKRGEWPWWGWLGIGLALVGWVLAWNRFAWFATFQRHCFILPWMGYLLTVNAITQRRQGSCLLTRRSGGLIQLAALSGLFWWTFEYLNQFVQNWYYLAVERFGATTYALMASLAFCTVLPVVMSTYELLLTTRIFNQGLTGISFRLKLPSDKLVWGALILSGSGLAGIGVWPDLLFPLVWVTPLVLLTSADHLKGASTLLTLWHQGDYRHLVGPPVAALLCGLFWEMWNFGSLAKWRYSLPYLEWGHLFEMPLLGYGGYLPFGILCWLVAHPLFPELPPTGVAGAGAPDSHLP